MLTLDEWQIKEIEEGVREADAGELVEIDPIEFLESLSK